MRDFVITILAFLGIIGLAIKEQGQVQPYQGSEEVALNWSDSPDSVMKTCTQELDKMKVLLDALAALPESERNLIPTNVTSLMTPAIP